MPVDLSGVEEEIRQMAVEGMDAAGDGFVELASDRAPRDKGDLIAAIQHDGAQLSGDTVTVHAHCDVEYASFQDEGTNGSEASGPGKALMFEIDGETIFLTYPYHTNSVPATGFWTDTENQGVEIMQEAFG